MEDTEDTEDKANKEEEQVIDDLQLNNDPTLNNIIRRASITYIDGDDIDDADDDMHDDDMHDDEINNQGTDENNEEEEEEEERDEKYNSYQLKLVSQDLMSCVVDQDIGHLSDVIKSESNKTRKLIPKNEIIIMMIQHWFRSFDIINYSNIIIQITIEYYPFYLEISLNEIRGSILKKVVSFMEYYHYNGATQIEKPLKSANMREIVSEWEANFVEVDQETLFELILAANNLKIQALVDLTCAKVASMIKGKTPEEIRKRFNIQNDFTPEEEEAVRAENKWAEDS